MRSATARLPFIACIAIAIAITSSASVRAAPPAEHFARLPTFTDLELSPGGRYLAARVNVQNRYVLVVFDVSGDGLQQVYTLREDEIYSASWFEWVSSDRLLLSVAFLGKRGGLRSVKTDERRLFSVALPSGEIKPVFRNRRDEIPVQIQDRVVSFLHQDPEHILLQYSPDNPATPKVYKASVVKTSRHRTAMNPKRNVQRWRADDSGEVRIGSGVDDKGRRKLYLRKAGEKKWQDFSHRVANEQAVFRTVGFAAEPNQFYVISNHETDPAGLYRFDVETDSFGDLIFRHPGVDISSVRIDADTGEVARVNFVDDDVETVWFSRSPIQKAIGKLKQQFPDKSLSTYSVSRDKLHAVVRLQGGLDSGQYVIYNHAGRSVKVLPAQYPDLAQDGLGVTIATEYTARDGLTIPAFVTLPPGMSSLEAVKDLPFVIHPHGGPASRDFLRFSFDVQFLASRGYGVLQMNFRGSSGYGQAFKQAGQREWGQAMQDDITDGVQWLIDNGYADPSRLAILGGSYGGYAALMGAVKTPDLFQCAVSFAGVSDLPDLLRLQRRFVNGRYATRFIGDLWKDRKMLAENSPARRAADIQIPILLLHGEKDTVVDIAQSKKMARALRKKDKPHKLVVFPDGDHHHSLYADRLQYLKETDLFLADCLASTSGN